MSRPRWIQLFRPAPRPNGDRGVEQWSARRAHNSEVARSNRAPAIQAMTSNKLHMQNIKLHQLVRISSVKAARKLGISLYTIGRVTWVATRSTTVEVNIGDRRVMVESNHLERVKVKK